jgi:hypothetical protein
MPPVRRCFSADAPRAQSLQPKLVALVVVVVDVIMHASFQGIKAVGRCKVEILAFKVLKKLSIAALSKQLPFRLMRQEALDDLELELSSVLLHETL